MVSSSTALFVIDIQHSLVGDSKTEIPHADRIKDAGTNILAAARKLNQTSERPALIVFVQHEETPDKGDLVRGSEAWKLTFDPQLNLESEILVSKTTRDTFESNTDLATQLKGLGISNICIFGVQSECCVQSTSLSALEAGFEVTVLQGAHSTYNTDGKTAIEIEASVEDLFRSRGAKVIGWEDAVASWETNQTFG